MIYIYTRRQDAVSAAQNSAAMALEAMVWETAVAPPLPRIASRHEPLHLVAWNSSTLVQLLVAEKLCIHATTLYDE
jgi:hypothetical protein